MKLFLWRSAPSLSLPLGASVGSRCPAEGMRTCRRGLPRRTGSSSTWSEQTDPSGPRLSRCFPGVRCLLCATGGSASRRDASCARRGSCRRIDAMHAVNPSADTSARQSSRDSSPMAPQRSGNTRAPVDRGGARRCARRWRELPRMRELRRAGRLARAPIRPTLFRNSRPPNKCQLTRRRQCCRRYNRRWSLGRVVAAVLAGVLAAVLG